MPAIVANLHQLTEYVFPAIRMPPPIVWAKTRDRRRRKINADPSASQVPLDNAQGSAAVRPVRYDQHAVNLPFRDQGGNFLTIFPGAGRRQQMNRPGRDALLDSQLGCVLGEGCFLARLQHVACVPKFGGQILLMESDALLDARHTTAQDDNCVNFSNL